MVLMRLGSWVERTFFVLPASWSRPAEELPACDALALHRLRWFAVPSLLVAALDLALLAGDGFRASRLGLLGGALVQSLVLLVTSARPVGRTLGHAQKVTHFLSIMLCFTIAAMTVDSYALAQQCDLLRTQMYKPSRCAFSQWELSLQSLFALGTMMALQVARRHETGLLLGLMAQAGMESMGDQESQAVAPDTPPPSARRAGLLIMAAPRAEVLPPDEGGDESGEVLIRGVLIRTSAPLQPQRQAQRHARQAPRRQLARKLTQ